MTTDEARLMLDSAVSACCGPDANNAWAIIKTALADATARAEREGKRAATLHDALSLALQDLREWRQFAGYNVRGELCGEIVPIPEPQRPTEIGLSRTEEVISQIQDAFKATHAAANLDAPATGEGG